MSILFRYIFKRFASAFVLCLGILVLILFMNKFLGLFNIALMKGAPLSWVFTSFGLLLPYFLTLTAPLAYLIGVMVAVDQFGRADELTALRAAGFSFLEFLKPFLALGLALSALMLYVNHQLAPEALRSFHRRYAEASKRVSSADIEPGTFSTIGPWRVYVRAMDRGTGRLFDAYLLEWQEDLPIVIKAPRGLFVGEGPQAAIELYDGSLVAPTKDPGKISVGRFKRSRIRLSSVKPSSFLKARVKETTSAELLVSMRGEMARSEPWYRLGFEMTLRSAMAVAPLVFGLVAVPLFFQLERGRRVMGFAGGVAFLGLFYWLSAVGFGLARRQPEWSLAAPWLADASGIVLGAILCWRASRL